MSKVDSSTREKLVLSLEDAKDLRYEDGIDYDIVDGVEVNREFPIDVISREHTGAGRWEQHYDTILAYKGKFWKWSYRLGSTENQEDRDLYDRDLVATEVFPRQQTVTVYD